MTYLFCILSSFANDLGGYCEVYPIDWHEMVLTYPGPCEPNKFEGIIGDPNFYVHKPFKKKSFAKQDQSDGRV